MRIVQAVFFMFWLGIPVGFLAVDKFELGVAVAAVLTCVVTIYGHRMKCRACGYSVWRRGRVWAGYVQDRCWNCKTPFTDQVA